MSTIRITCVLNETRRLASRFVCEVVRFVLFCLFGLVYVAILIIILFASIYEVALCLFV